MKGKRSTFLDAMGDIEERYIIEASEEWKGEESMRKSGRKKSRKRVFLLAAATAALCAGSVIAADRGGLIHLFERQFASREAREKIVSEIPVKVSGPEHIPDAYVEEGTMDLWNDRPALPDDSALLAINEIQYDGISLYIAAAATESGEPYELNADRLYINDEEYGPVSTGTDPEDENLYSFHVDLSGLNLTGTFQVTLPLSVYDRDGTRYQNQELTFEVNADSKTASKKLKVSTFEHDELTLEVTDVEISATEVRISAQYRMKEGFDPEKEGPVLALFSEDGKELNFLVGSDTDEEGGVHRVMQTYARADFGEGQPEKLILGTRLVARGGYIREYPVLYKDVAEIVE